ncbi:MAG TPA: hypothetical protein VKU89_07180 [Solirubrobacteraceae bacterium]|nr:hypothetical protein [Solirubrobacteraceae bacterium]
MSTHPNSSPPPLPTSITAAEPAFVREGGQAVKQAWQEGEAFEGMLLEQLTGELARTSGLLGGSEEGEAARAGAGEEAQEATAGSDAGGSMVMESYLPHVLSEALQRAGGLGLASSLAHRAQQAGGASPTPAQAQAGGAAAPAAGTHGAGGTGASAG